MRSDAKLKFFIICLNMGEKYLLFIPHFPSVFWRRLSACTHYLALARRLFQNVCCESKTVHIFVIRSREKVRSRTLCLFLFVVLVWKEYCLACLQYWIPINVHSLTRLAVLFSLPLVMQIETWWTFVCRMRVVCWDKSTTVFERLLSSERYVEQNIFIYQVDG